VEEGAVEDAVEEGETTDGWMMEGERLKRRGWVVGCVGALPVNWREGACACTHPGLASVRRES